ncbi:MAG: hypothetical protein NDF55_10210 [archaeon GB-1867-005]|nr:hypothetical protein [Candidatus Culexmicrobium cathedralense]
MKGGHPIKCKRAMVGLEAAIVLIAFVIVAAAFSFMVVNMGLFATQRGRDVIQQGIREAGCPLMVDGSILVKASNETGKAKAFIIPLKTMGTKWVSMWKNETVVSLMIGTKAWANIYQGIGVYNGTETQIDPSDSLYDTIIANLTKGSPSEPPSWWGQLYSNDTGSYITGAVLVIENSNGDNALQHYEKGFLIIILSRDDEALSRERVVIEVRPEKSAPLTLEFTVPEALPENSYVIAG